MQEEAKVVDAAIRRYDLHTGEYRNVVTAREDGYWHIGDDTVTYGCLTAFKLGDMIYLYDMEKDQIQEHLTEPGPLAALWLGDNKVFVITYEDDEARVYYSEIDNPGWKQVDNRGEESMLFSIYGEIDSMFYGLYHGCNSLIPKADFYAGNYEAAQAGGV